MLEHSHSKAPNIVRAIAALAIAASLGACGPNGSKAKTPATSAISKPEAASSSEPGPGGTAGSEAAPQMLAWYCPTAAAGRPGLQLLMTRDPTWSADPKTLQMAVGTRRVKRFTVFGWRGQSAGSFSVAGAARAGGVDLAVGSYLGSSPCALQSALGKSDEEDEFCLRELAGCALAVAEMESAGGFQARPYEEDPETGLYAASQACEIGDELVIDMDGDGAAEHFSLGEMRGSSDAPSELPYLSASSETCEGQFAGPVPGGGGLIRVAVVDLDADGRPEIVYQRNQNEFLLYGAPTNPARLELLGRRVLTSAPP